MPKPPKRETPRIYIRNQWVRESGLPPSARLLLRTLIDYADEAGECFPSQEQLRQDCGWQDVKSVQRNLDTLAEEGFIEIDHRKTSMGNRGNLYRLQSPDLIAALNAVAAEDDPEQLAVEEPWEGYARERPSDIIEAIGIALEDEFASEIEKLALLAHMRLYELAHDNRREILRTVETASRSLNGAVA